MPNFFFNARASEGFTATTPAGFLRMAPDLASSVNVDTQLVLVEPSYPELVQYSSSSEEPSYPELVPYSSSSEENEAG
jgi:hypothetical protein